MFDHELRAAAEHVLVACRSRKLKVVTAESCTGGLVAAALTAIAGSSDVVERGFVTYANEAKREMLGVSWDALLGHGAVSEPVARAMAAGALARRKGVCCMSFGTGEGARPCMVFSRSATLAASATKIHVIERWKRPWGAAVRCFFCPANCARNLSDLGPGSFRCLLPTGS